MPDAVLTPEKTFEKDHTAFELNLVLPKKKKKPQFWDYLHFASLQNQPFKSFIFTHSFNWVDSQATENSYSGGFTAPAESHNEEYLKVNATERSVYSAKCL